MDSRVAPGRPPYRPASGNHSYGWAHGGHSHGWGYGHRNHGSYVYIYSGWPYYASGYPYSYYPYPYVIDPGFYDWSLPGDNGEGQGGAASYAPYADYGGAYARGSASTVFRARTLSTTAIRTSAHAEWSATSVPGSDFRSSRSRRVFNADLQVRPRARDGTELHDEFENPDQYGSAAL